MVLLFTFGEHVHGKWSLVKFVRGAVRAWPTEHRLMATVSVRVIMIILSDQIIGNHRH